MKTLLFILLLLLSVGMKAQTDDRKDDDDTRIREAAEKVISIRENPNYDRLDKLFYETDVVFDYAVRLDEYKATMEKLNNELNETKTKDDAQRKPKENH